MGVTYLMKTCIDHQERCAETVDLVEVAKRRNGIELLVDFYAFVFDILEQISTKLCSIQNNQYLDILGGEYESINTCLSNFVEDLKSNGILLVFYIDAAKGSSKLTSKHKLEAWASRHSQDMDALTKVMEILRGNEAIESLERKIRPVLVEVQVLEVLKKCGCEIYQALMDEADALLIKALRERPKAYAILSNDSDFCVMKECRLIPFQLFDIGKNLQLSAVRTEKPKKLKVMVITTEKIMRLLEISDHDMFIDLCMLLGNDYTKSLMREKIHPKLNVKHARKYPSVQEYAFWIRSCNNEWQKVLATEMSRNRALLEAVTHSRELYKTKVTCEVPQEKCDISKIIVEHISSGDFPSDIMSIHHNVYWHRFILEDHKDGKTVERALRELRTRIYRIVLSRDETHVEEYGMHSSTKDLQHERIIAVDDETIPKLDIIYASYWNNDRYISGLFHKIMSHQEISKQPQNWFDKYEWKNGFIVYILRYFLRLNWKKNLRITENEFLALVAMTLGSSNESFYQKITLLPPPRAVTILNWLQDVYLHAYAKLGSILHLKQKFPIPSELFSGSVWTVMFMACERNTFDDAKRRQNVPLDELKKVQKEMNSIISEKRHILLDIVCDIFPPDTIQTIIDRDFVCFAYL